MRVLVTGAAGFIGLHLSQRLTAAGHRVIAVDLPSAWATPALHAARWDTLAGATTRHVVDIRDADALTRVACTEHTDTLVHLAALPGVRASALAPRAYLETNYGGTVAAVQAARAAGAAHLVLASSSSVYGGAGAPPFREDAPCDQPLSVYAATKRAAELWAAAAAGPDLRVTVARLFSVYGPWGRPDMAPLLFLRALEAGEPVTLYDGGGRVRDLTAVEDVAEALARLLERPPPPDAPVQTVNVGRGRGVTVRELLGSLEAATGRRARVHEAPGPAGEAEATGADVSRLLALTGFRPARDLGDVLPRVVAWYREGGARLLGRAP